MRFFVSVLAPGVALDLACAGRRLHLTLRGPAAFGAFCFAAAGALLAVFGLFMLLFGDVWPKMTSRSEAAVRAEYEDRIVRLRNRIDELASRNALDRTTIDGTVRDLAARQTRLEQRHAMLAELAGEIAPAPARGKDRRAEGAAPSAPIGGEATVARALDLPRDRSAAVERLRTGLDALEARQTDFINSIVIDASERVDLKTRALAELRLTRSARPLPLDRPGLGGPEKSVKDFDMLRGTALTALAERRRLAELVLTLPLGRPVDGDPELTSGFGIRTDPFTRRPAMHEGLDLRLEPGVPVKATGAGRVVAAGNSGSGYGLMVEIEHGYGLSTIYAHLSAVRVREGETIAAGSTVGLSGNTGRSTGPHLHYETRIDGEAVDPVRFLRAGERIRRL
jgi:murein DD-endopeptidase MepM/ murein hydrolase activator NlpD